MKVVLQISVLAIISLFMADRPSHAVFAETYCIPDRCFECIVMSSSGRCSQCRRKANSPWHYCRSATLRYHTITRNPDVIRPSPRPRF